MDESFKSLREKVLKAVEEARDMPKVSNTAARKRFLLEFIRIQLRKSQQDETGFAKVLNIPLEELDNGFQYTQLNTLMLEKIAQAIHCDASLLSIMLHGSSTSRASELASSSD